MKKTPTTKTLRVSASPRETPYAAARHHATEAFRLGSQAAQHAILCGIELIRLREQHGTNQGARNDLAETSPQRGGKSSQGRPSHPSSPSWPELVHREVGLPEETARRWMQAARNQLPALATQLQLADGTATIEAVAEVLDQPQTLQAVAALTAGKTLEQLMLPLDHATARLDISKLSPKKRQRYDELQDAAAEGDPKAAALIRQIDAGTLDPGRAYAGWIGDQTRAAQGKTGRRDTDHANNIHAALKKLATSLPRHHDLEPEDQAALTRYWRTHHLGQLIPAAWTINR